ncbi:MAG: DUF4388 domain-containing protein [Nitrospirae bacterium]|nr:DUF4388 domain-containing protein [Nitrospirota bacterium]
MSLVGRLEDLALADIFQIISLSKKTGTLVLKSKAGAAVVVFRDGQVIQAATDNLRDTLGNILISKGLINERDLTRALDTQKKLGGGIRLGQILVEMGYLGQQDLEDTIRGQIENMIYSLLSWEDGFFNFDLGEVTPGDKIEVVTQEFLLKAGLNPEYLLMEGARVMDEKKRDGKVAAKAKAAQTVEAFPEPRVAPDNAKKKAASEFSDFLEEQGMAPSSAKVSGEERAVLDRSREMSTLKSMFEELRFPTATAEITLLVLRYASEVVNRSVLFMVTREDVKGLGQFGIELKEASADHRVRQIRVPVSEKSIFTEVVANKRSMLGRFSHTAWDAYLVKELGGSEPEEFFLIPLVSNDRVVALLYGDNLPDRKPVPNIAGLEIFVYQAGLAMEKALLERKIMELERLKEKNT